MTLCPEEEKKIQEAREGLMAALEEAVGALKETEYDPRVLFRSYPASEFRIHQGALRRAA
jgi:hypothetical protein